MKVLITGANGFIARHLVSFLKDKGLEVVGSVRSVKSPQETSGGTLYETGAIDGTTDWSAALESVDCVVHLAGLAHVFSGKQAGDLDAFRRVNTEGTLNLARQAAQAGVSRFVYLSSIGVLGTQSASGSFTNDSPAMPSGAYAISKSEAEQALCREFGSSAMPVVIIRPPLVYGPDAPGNFRRLVRLVSSGMPLPFGKLENVRSMISVNNLCDFIATCVVSDRADNRTFLISDGSDWSVSELVTRMRETLGSRARLVSVPPRVLTMLASAAGQRDTFERLSLSFRVSSADSWQVLGWNPPFSPEEELKKAVAGACTDS